jgi:hypothetical protein
LDLSPIIAYQEPVYQRYTSSLLWLYHPDPDHVLPQGQLLGPIHNGINWLLTLLGYGPYDQDVFFLRVNLFCWLAICATAGLTLVAINLMLRRVTNPLLGIVLAGVGLLPLLGSGAFGIWQVSKPDYEPYVLVLYLIAAGFIAMIIGKRSKPALSYAECMGAGCLIGASLSEKITLAILPFIIVITIVTFSTVTLRAFSKVSTIVASAVASFCAIWYLQYFSVGIAKQALQDIVGTTFNYGSDASTRVPLDQLLRAYVDIAAPLSLTERLALLVPGLAVAVLVVRPSRHKLRLACALVPAAAFYYWYLQARYVPTTQFEFLAFATFLVCLGALQAGPRLVARLSARATDALTAGAGLLLGVIFVGTVTYHLARVADPNGTHAARNAWEVYRAIPGRQLFLFEADGGQAKIENVMLGISNMIVPAVAKQRRDFVFAKQNPRALRLADYDSVVFYFAGSLGEYRQRESETWNAEQAGYPFFDFSAFTAETTYALRDGPFAYTGPGVYVMRQRARGAP